ncbi:MAG: metallophosphoesterase family protein, partial [Candidatus Woesearchaeota archaeon]
MTLCFAHIADCHVGSWRDPTMRALNMQYFSDVIDAIIAEKVDVLLVAGDLFNTAMPSVDALKLVTEKFKEVHDAGIKILGVSGSHDYSATGKSMLEVLEKAGLFTNVLQGSVDEHGTLSLTPTVYKGYNFVG